MKCNYNSVGLRMKGTEVFQKIIWNYLLERGEQDETIARNLDKDHKSFEECIKYILTEVRKSGCNAFTEEEIYSMAIHYYDEDNLKDIQDVPEVKIVVNDKHINMGNLRKKVKKSTNESIQELMFEDDETED